MKRAGEVIEFKWGKYKAIGMKHFEERRRERLRNSTTDIFDCVGLDDTEVIKRCFKQLEMDKYDYVLDRIQCNGPEQTEWLVAFETDEPCFNNPRKFNYVFIVFAINVKKTEYGKVKQGEVCLTIVTVVKDLCKNRPTRKSGVREEMLCFRRPNGGDFCWFEQLEC